MSMNATKSPEIGQRVVRTEDLQVGMCIRTSLSEVWQRKNLFDKKNMSKSLGLPAYFLD